MEHYSLKQIIQSLPKKKNSRSSLWVQLFVRKISFLFTYIFINLGFSANSVSVLSVFVVLGGSLCLCFNNFAFNIVGAIIINLWLVLDCVDGNIARCKKKSSYMGEFYDALGGYAATTFSIFGIGFAAFYSSIIIGNNFNYFYIVIGALGSVFNLFSRLVYQKYTVSVFTTNNVIGLQNELPENHTENKKSFAYIREQIDKQFGISGLFMILLLVAPFFPIVFEIMTFVYSLYYFLAFVYTFVMYSIRAKKFEESVNK